MMRLMHRRKAFTLTEVLVTVGITSLIMSAGVMIFVEVMQLRSAQDRYQRRLAGADFFLRRVARDVRAGHAFASAAGTFKAGEDTLIVSSAKQAIVYRAIGGKVERVIIGYGTMHQEVLLDTPGMRYFFSLDGATPAEARSVVATAEWEDARAGISKPTLSLRAALRIRRQP